MENYLDGGILLERWDASGYTRFDMAGKVVEQRPLSESEAAAVAAEQWATDHPPAPGVDARLANVEATVEQLDQIIVAVLS